MELGHVVVLAGGLSHEREVSLRSGRRVADALRSRDVPVELRDADATLLDSFSFDTPDAVFPVLHGAAGEDGSIRGVLELLGIPYVGARPDACRVTWDKPTAKAVVRRAGLNTPRSIALPKETFHDLGASAVLARILDHLGLPLFVKPTRGGSALGTSVVREAADLPAAMVACFGYGDAALVEQYIEGVEVAVSVIERDGTPLALPAVEIVTPNGRYDYTARYDSGDTEFVTPARLDPVAAARATEAAVTAHRALGLRDLSRTDMIVSPDNEVYFLEVNVAPGMTETSLLPRAVSAANLDLGTVCHDLLLQRCTR